MDHHMNLIVYKFFLPIPSFEMWSIHNVYNNNNNKLFLDTGLNIILKLLNLKKIIKLSLVFRVVCIRNTS